MMNKHLENIEGYAQEKLKNKEFKALYEIERAKVSLAQKIAEMRQGKQLNQKALAEKLGVSQQFISQIETGDGQNLTLDTLIKIAGSLGRRVRISFPKNKAAHAPGLDVA
jgi:DNA-binding XRE family transcriptional regulator